MATLAKAPAPQATCQRPNSIGWRFTAINPAGRETFFGVQSAPNPPQLNFQVDRDITRTLSGCVLLPADRDLINIPEDDVRLDLVLDFGYGNALYPMGRFTWSESVVQPGAILDSDSNMPGDLYTAGLSDIGLKLRRSDGTAYTLAANEDPAQAMRSILDQDGIPHNVAGCLTPTAQPTTWTGESTDLSKLADLAQLAGHRSPWVDNDGIYCSLSSRVGQFEAIDVQTNLYLESGSVAITESYLAAPNRVIVTEVSQSNYAIRGQWDAPAYAPNSLDRRGFVLTSFESQQGLRDTAHANEIAENIGRNYSGRKLSFQCTPTDLLDGPVILGYLGAQWQVNSWSVQLTPGALMSVDCQEVVQ